MGLAYVFVAKDKDSSGKVDLTEVNDFYGMGLAVVGYSEKEFIPAPSAPIPLDEVFPEGIEKGTHPYRIIYTGGDGALGRAKEGDVFDLNVCDGPALGCHPPVLNLD